MKELSSTVSIIGGGFTGLSAAYYLSKRGIKVTVLESEPQVGGLASVFDVNGYQLERFYHHWFTSDKEIMNLIEELGLSDSLEVNLTNTSIYYANNFFKFSTPWDLLKFTPISLIDRFRLGFLVLRARQIKNWVSLENKTARDWLIELGGEKVYKVIWEPLLKGKFGPYADVISAVWFWNKLKLRGGSRTKSGEEKLVYIKGGFATVAESLVKKIHEYSGQVCCESKVTSVSKVGNKWILKTLNATISSDKVIFTIPLPLIASTIESWAETSYLDILKRINYLGNMCLILELKESLSKTYWLNVNDPTFPFVGIIEHTNFSNPSNYGGKHIVYLSKYLPVTDNLYSKSPTEFYEYAIPYICKMFPCFNKHNVLRYHLWKASWSQPVVEKHYSSLIPDYEGPEAGMYIASMAQIYPEDRGTNYAIREGRLMADRVHENLRTSN